ncbi:cysteine-rich and transmembrane domain-containing protein B-like [Gigantopelta aegis]|uniref:cysteine-rich and transmembrane domain-containing protein B-like n=1 Tax=Gigantopelta aegis TaxID=1735272 RepID=UPI001B888BE9|nr:cysteine-rich and transmembrane domain-containing protein B-like [Gigantopelta aegis]
MSQPPHYGTTDKAYGEAPPPYPPGQPYPPQQGYAQQGYGQAGYANPGYGIPPTQQQQSTVVVVGQTGPTQTVIIQENRGVNHVLHCIISLFFLPWVIVWIILCITEGA